jgi:hypothetical protein
MTVSGYAWSHPEDRQQAKARLIGRQRLNAERKRFAGLRRDQEVWPLLLKYGWDTWGVCTRIAEELGVHKSTITRDRRAILRSMLGL